MTEADDDKKVREAYGALGGEEPSRVLDEAILAASRRTQSRWRVPLSIAAVLVLAVGVTLRLLPQRPDAESVALAPQVIETPKPAAGAAEPAAKFAQDVPGPAAPSAGAPSAAAGNVAGARTKPAETPAQLAAAATSAAEQNAKRAEPSAPAALADARRADEVAASAAPVAGAMQRDAAATAESRARALAAAPSAAGVPAAAKAPEAALTPEAWLTRIAELRKQGREREAQESLAEFKKRYPGYKIPEALR